MKKYDICSAIQKVNDQKKMKKDEVKFWYLKNHRLFEKLPQDELQKVKHICEIEVKGKSEQINISSADCDKFYIIKEGAVKIISSKENGKEVILELLNQGDMFGPLDSQINSSADIKEAVCLTEHTTVCCFDLKSFTELMNSSPNMALIFNKVVSEKLISIQTKYMDLITKDAKTRVLDFFLNYMKRFGSEENGIFHAPMYFTHQEIADYIGVSKQTTTSEINLLEKAGKLIYLSRKEISMIIST
jgi:CRP/FNR family transcriptional regulator, cyclic AMP receptor protein